MIDTFCLNCGNLLNSKQKKYCSITCQQENQYKIYIKRWLAGEEDGVRSEGSPSAHIRRYLFEINGNKCSTPDCGWGKVNTHSGKIPLTINHKNGNSDDHKPENLELLCPNCHSLTPTYGRLNEGKGRRKRLEKIRVLGLLGVAT